MIESSSFFSAVSLNWEKEQGEIEKSKEAFCRAGYLELDGQ